VKILSSQLMALSVLLLASVAVQAAELYRSVDHDGKVQYSDLPIANGETKTLYLDKSVPQVNLPYETRMAMKNFPVTLYVAEGCGEGCSRGHELLTKRGVPFIEKKLATQDDVNNLKKLSGSNGVPVLAVGKVLEKGFLAEAWQQALDKAGYPKFAPYVNQPKDSSVPSKAGQP